MKKQKIFESLFMESNDQEFMDKLEQFMDKYPDDANSWSEATDEMKDLARIARETYNETSSNTIEPLNFRSFRYPSEWNSESKKFVRETYQKMSKEGKESFMREVEETFF